MRYLHPVSIKERFVASGEYTYWLGDQHGGHYERWTIHRQPDGSRFYRFDYESSYSGLVILGEVLENTSNEIERTDIKLFSTANSEPDLIPARVTYTVMRDEGYVQIGRSIDKKERETFEVEFKSNMLFNPFFTFFTGKPVRLSAIHNENAVSIFSFDTKHEPVINTTGIIGHFLREDDIAVDNKMLKASCYQHMNPERGQPLFWLDKNGILLQSVNERGVVARLSRYLHI